MLSNFQKCLQVTLAYEGGYSNDRRDPGNWTGGKVGKGQLKGTKYGIAASSHPDLDIRNLTVDDAAKIYKPEYWDKVSGDRLAAGVDLATWDAGVQSGPSRALKWLLASAGGPDSQTVKKICAKRLGFFQTLAIWKSYKKGLVNRVASVEAKGVAWALAALPATAVKAKLVSEGAAAKKSAGRNAIAASGVGGTTSAGGADAVANPRHVDLITGWGLAGIVVLAVVVIALLILRAHIHERRAAAYEAEAATIGGV